VTEKYWGASYWGNSYWGGRYWGLPAAWGFGEIYPLYAVLTRTVSNSTVLTKQVSETVTMTRTVNGTYSEIEEL